MVLADAQLGVSTHSRSELLASGAGDHKRIRARRLDDLHPSVEGSDRLCAPIDAFLVIDRLRPDAKNDLGAIGQLALIGVCRDWKNDGRMVVTFENNSARAVHPLTSLQGDSWPANP